MILSHSAPLSAPELLKRITGLPLDDERLAAALAAYEPILQEIARLRSLDLHDAHPAVVFDPSVAYRSAA